MVLRALLKAAGFEVVEAADGASALSALRQCIPDLILLDLTLPDIGGMLLLDLIHAQETHKHVPVFFLTGNLEPPTKVQAFEKGAVDYITKPFNPQELIARIHSHLGRKDELEQRRRAATELAEEAQRSLKQAEERFNALVRNSFDLLCELDDQLRLVYASPNHHDILRCDPEALIGTDWLERVHPEDQLAAEAALLEAQRSGSSFRMLVRFRHSKNTWRWLDVSGSVLAELDSAARLLLVSRDITQAKETEAHLDYLAHHDPLTKLGNRQMFTRELAQMLAAPAGARGAVIFIDLDNFKLVNDTQGHHVGDQVLCAVADLLRSRLRDRSLICRLGGDEFCILQRNVTAEEVMADCQRLLLTMRQNVMGDLGQRLGVTLSVGIAMVEPGIRSEELLSRADSALSAAKIAGKNQARLYLSDNAELAGIRSASEWYQRVQQGLDEQRFELFFQPIVSLGDHSQLCQEALVRYRDEDGELHSPAAFLPAAERYGLMPKLDRYIIRRAVAELAKRDQLRAAVNLSGHSIVEKGMSDFILSCLRHAGVAPSRLIFEITETVFISNMHAAQHFVAAMKKSGCRFSLDDFGAGFSSLSYLRNLPVDFVKIDGSFVDKICQDPADLALLRSINEIAHLLGKSTIAEYIDSEEKLKLLQELGVDYAQGYHLGRPAPLPRLPRRESPSLEPAA